MALSKEGSLESLSLAAYLAQLARTRANGTFRLERDSLIKVLYFQEGLVAYASSNEEADRLGQVLIRAGKLTKEQLDLATSRLAGGKTLGKQLTEMGFITPEELLWAAKKQVEDIAVSLFGWPSGTYEWMEGELPEGLVHLKLPTESLLLSGVFSIEDREQILNDLQGHDAVYNFTADFMDTYEKLSVPEAVDTVIAGVDGVRTVRDLAQLSREGEFRGYQILFFAKAYGLVECIKAKTVDKDVPTAKRIEAQAPSPPAAAKPAEKKPAATPSPPAAAPSAPPPAVADVLGKTKDAAQEAPVDTALEASQEAAQENLLADVPLGDKGSESLFNVDPSLAKESSGAPRKLLLFLFVVFLLAAGAFGLRTYFRINPPAWLAFWQEEATDLSMTFKDKLESPIPPSEQTSAAPAPLSSEEPQEGERTAPEAETPPEPEMAAERAEPAPARREPPPEPEPVAAPPSETGKLPFPRDAEARASLRRGRYTDAADVWKKDLERIPSSHYAIQIAIFCEVSSVKRSWEESNQGASFYIVSSPFKGRPCFRACWGVYENRSKAERAKAAMPRYFQELRYKPQIVRVSSLR
jgi:outer membrane biosynthesis protein TonB